MARFLDRWRLSRVERRLKKLRFEQHEARRAIEDVERERRTKKIAESDFKKKHDELERTRDRVMQEIHALVVEETELKSRLRLEG